MSIATATTTRTLTDALRFVFLLVVSLSSACLVCLFCYLGVRLFLSELRLIASCSRYGFFLFVILIWFVLCEYLFYRVQGSDVPFRLYCFFFVTLWPVDAIRYSLRSSRVPSGSSLRVVRVGGSGHSKVIKRFSVVSRCRSLIVACHR